VDAVLHHTKDYRKVIKEIFRVLDGELQLWEAVNNNLLFRVGRNLIQHWKGMLIHSKFTFFELQEEIRKFFLILDIKEFDLSLPILFPYAYTGKKTPFLINLFNQKYNLFIEKLHLMPYFITSVSLIARTKKLALS